MFVRRAALASQARGMVAQSRVQNVLARAQRLSLRDQDFDAYINPWLMDEIEYWLTIL